MTWTKLGENFADRADLAGCSRSARLLYVESLVYCNRAGNDGEVPTTVVPRMTDSEDLGRDVAELVGAGLWDATDTGYRVNMDDQLSVDEVKALRTQANVRQRRRRLHTAGNHSECSPRYCDKAVTRDSQGDSRLPTGPTGPTDPEGQGGSGKCRHGRMAGDDDQGDPFCYECANERHSAGEQVVRPPQGADSPAPIELFPSGEPKVVGR